MKKFFTQPAITNLNDFIFGRCPFPVRLKKRVSNWGWRGLPRVELHLARNEY